MRSSTFSSLRGLLAAASLGLMGMAPGGIGLGTPSGIVAPAMRPSANQRRFKGSPPATQFTYPNGPGWTQAKVQRMAKKRRNVLRNRKNHKA